MPPLHLLLISIALLINLVSSFSYWSSEPCKCKRRPPYPHPTAIFSTAITHQDVEKQTQQYLHKCQGCNQIFKSRNTLFRHIRGEDDASVDCPLSTGNVITTEEELLTTAVIRYGYIDGTKNNAETNDIVANMIHRAFVHHMNTFLVGERSGGESQHFTVSTSALTYSTAAKMRQPSLRQDEEVVAATSEVLSFNYRLSSSPTSVTDWKEYANSGPLQGLIQDWLVDGHEGNCQIQIQLHQMDALVPRSSKFYAERSCTQGGYRYLLPIDWILPRNGTMRVDAISQMEEWLQYITSKDGDKINVKEGVNARTNPRSGGQGQSMASPESPPFIKQLKQSLKAAESQTVPNRRQRRQERSSSGDASDTAGGITSATNTNPLGPDEFLNDSSSIRLAPGRFGQLWRKRRRCWSSFAHPRLIGMGASPGHEAVWRTMDRAKIVGFTDLQNPNGGDYGGKLQNMHIILDFRADGFVVGQIPRIVSALVAMTNGWLPQNFFEIATRPDVYIPAPPPPPFLEKRLYFQSARYHFHEMTSNGTHFTKTIHSGSQSEQNWEVDLRKRLLGKLYPENRKVEDWLLELQDIVSPDLRRQIKVFEADTIAEQSYSAGSVQKVSKSLPMVDTDAPKEYITTLDLLRGVVNSGKWPATSDARSRVIKSSGGSSGNILVKKGALASTLPGNTISSGSFTVVNDEIWESDALPLANSLFPELTKAVFELEQKIIRQTSTPLSAADGLERQSSTFLRRSPSTHCAVNRNARFTPHVDSGRGQGQSVSLIAGLGNFTGGEILVENKQYGIRYNALEFDGWKQLHWTAPFKGERYSLVWFTPDVS